MRRFPFLLSLLLLALFPVTARGEGWYLFANHIHSSYSEDNEELTRWKRTPGELIEMADERFRSLGMSGGIAITDHRTLAQTRDPGFAPVGVAQPIVGVEWGVSGEFSGHAGLLGLSGEDPPSSDGGPEKFPRMIEETHDRGGIVIINHPFSDGTPWTGGFLQGEDAIEIWNTVVYPGIPRRRSSEATFNAKAMAFWQQLLEKGHRVPGVGGSDYHFDPIDPFGIINLVWAQDDSPAAIIDAVREGHVVILMKPEAPRAIPEVDLDGDGTVDLRVGDLIEIDAPRSITFTVRIERARASNLLKVYEPGGRSFVRRVTGKTTLRFSRDYTPRDRSFFRVELWSSAGVPRSISNPIYIVGSEAPAPDFDLDPPEP